MFYLFQQYYNSKALKEENPNAALESFQRVLDLEKGDKGEWGFKALKQVKLKFPQSVCFGCKRMTFQPSNKSKPQLFKYLHF